MVNPDLEREALLGELAGGPVNQTMPTGPRLTDQTLGERAATTPTVDSKPGAVPGAGMGAAATGGPRGIAFGQNRITGDMSRVRGVDPNNWGNMDSTKYRALEFLSSQGPVTINSVKKMVQDPRFQEMFPGVTFDGKDHLVFGGMVDPHSGAAMDRIDILQSADPNNPDQELALYWNDLANDGGGGPMPGGGGIMDLMGSGEALTSNDSLQEILRAVQALAEGQDPSRDALLQELSR